MNQGFNKPSLGWAEAGISEQCEITLSSAKRATSKGKVFALCKCVCDIA